MILILDFRTGEAEGGFKDTADTTELLVEKPPGALILNPFKTKSMP